MTPAHLEKLLAPVAADRPAGEDASYAAEFDDIRKCRKGDDPTLSQGEWVREIRMPQWPKVRDLCEALLVTRSKDLQVACWYAEAMTYLEGFQGLTFGFRLLEGLLTRYWEPTSTAFYPEDLEERVAKLEWFNAQMPLVIRAIPMTSPKVGGFSHLKWEESRQVENLGIRDGKAKEQALSEGKLSGEAWDKAASASGQAFYLRLAEQIQHASASFRSLEERITQRFAGDAPAMNGIQGALQACTELANALLKRFGLDPQVEVAMAAAPTVNLDDAAPRMTGAPAVAGVITSRAEAIRRLREVAKYFRDHEPHSPVGPLAERAARWGEMPLEQWLARVIKDESTLGQLRDLLDLQPEL